MVAENHKSMIAQRRLQARNAGDQEYSERRANLMIAAAKVFKEKGYRAASINDMAQAVGIDRASLYYYVSGKEELFQEIVHEAALSNILMAEEVSREPGSPSEKIEKFVSRLMMSFEQHYPYLYVYVQEDMTQITKKSGRWAKDMKKLAKRFDDAVVEIIEAGLRDGSFKGDKADARLIAFGIIGLCNWSHRWFKPGSGKGADAVGRIFANMILRGLQR